MNQRPWQQAASSGRPLSARECMEQALAYTFDVFIPLKIYIRSFKVIFKEANIYWGEGNLAQAYTLMYRASDLLLKKVSTHPESKTPDGRRMIKEVTGQASQVIRDLEELKPLVEGQYEEWEKLSASKKAVSNGHCQEPLQSKKLPGKQYSPMVLDARDQQNQSLNQVLRRVSRRAYDMRREGTVSHAPREVESRRKDSAHGSWDGSRAQFVTVGEDDEDYTRRQMEAARRRLDASNAERFVREGKQPLSSSYASHAPSYPALRPSHPVNLQPKQPLTPSYISSPLPPTTHLPPRPPKDYFYQPLPSPPPPPLPRPLPPHPLFPLPPQVNEEELSAIAPSRPQKVPVDAPIATQYESTSDLDLIRPKAGSAPIRPSKVPDTMTTHLETENIVFKAADHLESGEALRPLFLPQDMEATFLGVAEPNTKRGLETCGLLCGNLHKNALFVTTLLIPEQESTDNTCDTVNEGSIWKFCEDNDVIIMGWIHTHPTQTCFLSSRDLHTHAVYQVQLPESVAIVCAPKFGNYGIFRCTDPPGKEMILKCTRPGIFHPHDPYRDDELYKICDGARGHVMETSQLSTTLIDIRPKVKS